MIIPKGYKLVPVEPTCSMVLAGLKALGGCVGSCGEANPPDGSDILDAFSAMLATAPSPPQPIYDEAKERELFEAWSAEHYYLGGCTVVIEDGEYKDTDMQYSWESWEARAKAVEVGHE